ncbi:MAG: MFS transporter [Campylobacterota bacterium]|nr:MFS transporter [Campylobacterota bacterium]
MKRTVQGYIDEIPQWSDGTPSSSAPLTHMQWLILVLAAGGKFFEGLVVLMTGVAVHLIAFEFNLDAIGKGVIAAAPLFGILIGATMLGGLSDHYGRKKMFLVEMIIFILFLVGLMSADNFYIVVFSLFGIGMALGCDYPTAHAVITESMPSRSRGKLVLGTFAFQAVGAVFGTGIAYFTLVNNPDNIEAWRYMYAIVIIPAFIILIGRFKITMSPHWLLSQGRTKEAESELSRLLSKDPQYPKEIKLNIVKSERSDTKREEQSRGSYMDLFRAKYFKTTIFASVPWFLQDLGTYGIGIFTPTILAYTVGHKHAEHNVADMIESAMMASKGAAMLDTLLIVGILFAIFLTDRLGRVKLQFIGFTGCAVGLAIVAFSQRVDNHSMQTMMIFAGFIIFNFMTNMGPNSQTYLI